MNSNYLTITSRNEGDHILIIEINGRLDESTFDIFLDEIKKLNESDYNVIINLENLKYISSSGIRAIFDLKNEMTAARQKLALTGANERIVHIFSLLGLWKTFDHFDTVKEATVFILK